MNENINEDEFIKQCYKALHLDERASKNEVELAYETLTKKSNSANLVDGEIHVLKVCYDYLMSRIYGECDKKNENDLPNQYEQNNDNEENQIYIDILSETPNNVKGALDYIQEFTGNTYSEKTKALFSVQNVNLPLLGHALLTNGLRFGNIHIYDDADINMIIKQSCQNDICYYSSTFEFSFEYVLSKQDLEDIRQFVRGLKEIKFNDGITCLKFDIKNTPRGVMGCVIAIPSLIDELEILFRNKAKHLGVNLNMTVNQ